MTEIAWQVERNRKARERFSHCHEKWEMAATMRQAGMKIAEVGKALGVCESRVSQMCKQHRERTTAVASHDGGTP